MLSTESHTFLNFGMDGENWYDKAENQVQTNKNLVRGTASLRVWIQNIDIPYEKELLDCINTDVLVLTVA